MTYLQAGRAVSRVLFRGSPSSQIYFRSLIYGLSILPFHRNVNPWGIVVLNALVTSFILWLVVRSLLPRHTISHYFALLLPLSACTSLGWLVSWIMPDILGPLLYLSIYLLVFAYEDLSRAEFVAVILIAWWGAASHITHLVLGMGLCILLIAVLALQRQLRRHALSAIGGVSLLIVTVAIAVMAINAAYYGQPSLDGKGPPFLMARVIADGPGRWYLQKECGRLQLSICAHVHDLPDNVVDFLWLGPSAWNTFSLSEQERLWVEEMPFVVGVLREYRWQQLMISARNFWQQARTFDLYVERNPFILQDIEKELPGARSRYLQTRQAQARLHEHLFDSVQDGTVIVSLILIAIGMIKLRERLSPRLGGLTAIILFVVIANAAITGPLSGVTSRYQERVIWLLPLLAGIFVLTWLDRRSPALRQPI